MAILGGLVVIVLILYIVVSEMVHKQEVNYWVRRARRPGE